MKAEIEIIESIEERNSLAEHLEVLERVKKLFLLPGTGCITVKQVAEFYEVGSETIQSVYKDHRSEFELDGVKNTRQSEVLNVLEGQLDRSRTKVAVIAKADGKIYEIPNRGLKLFPRRAVLRVGMLLRDSKVVREVRTQLLNIEDKATSEIKVQSITEEQQLIFDIGKAYVEGDMDSFAKATMAYKNFLSRHAMDIQKNGKIVSDEKLGWQKRNQLNAAMRQLSRSTGIPVYSIWNELYSNLEFGCRICVKKRGNPPYIQYLEEKEWGDVVNRFNMMCDDYEEPKKKIR